MRARFPIVATLLAGCMLLGCETSSAGGSGAGDTSPDGLRDTNNDTPGWVWDTGGGDTTTPGGDTTKPGDTPVQPEIGPRDATQTVETRCTPSLAWCQDDVAHKCNSDGTTDYVRDCSPGVCRDGECYVCAPTEAYCNESDRNLYQCNADGTGGTLLQECNPRYGCYENRCLVCYPGIKDCDEQNHVVICNADGSGWDIFEDCGAAGAACASPGLCVGGCGTEIKTGTNTGCDFWAVDLENALEEQLGQVWDAQHAQFSVIVSNTAETAAADITITRPDGVEITGSVAPGDLQVFNLSNYPSWDFSLEGSGITNKAFHITTTQPVNVYQFNPLSNVGVFSNDASVLLPTPGLGTEYYTATLPQITDGIEPVYRGYFTVIAIDEESTTVTITPAGPTLAGSGIPALTAGQTHSVTLQRGEVLNVESNTADEVDLSGSHILSDRPVAVFSGHVAAVTAQECCADHLEEQMPPLTSWGTQYVATRAWERGYEGDYWMVVASENDTTVTLNPMVATIPRLSAGGKHYFKASQNFVATASKPVLLVQFLASSYETPTPPGGCSASCPEGFSCFLGDCQGDSCSGSGQCSDGATCTEGYCQPIGDPSLIVAVPVQQFQDGYIFLTPNSYHKDYLNVIAPTGATVTLDGVDIPPASFTAVMGSGFGVHRREVPDGTHVIQSDVPFGIVVYGYDKDVSYGYPGGLGLEVINPSDE